MAPMVSVSPPKFTARITHSSGCVPYRSSAHKAAATMQFPDGGFHFTGGCDGAGFCS